MTGTLVAITSYLRSIHIGVPDGWAEACIDWLQDEHQNSGEHLSLDKIKELIYEQWLVADLTELGMQYLPPQVATAEKYSLSGYFCLQVNSMIDVSTSFYSQQVKLKGIDTTNSSVTYDETKKAMWQPPHTRMFKLELTDGTTKVYAMEYNTIPDLKPELKPGFKVLIKGNVLCRKGMLMLKKENLKVLGGEVDSLIETNTTQQLLTKAMEDCAAYAGESVRYEFTEADAAKFTSRIKSASKKKGDDLPGIHNMKSFASRNSSRFTQGKNSSWNSKSPVHKTESWKPKLNNLEDTSMQSNTGVHDFDDEWGEDFDDLDDALIAATHQSSSQVFAEKGESSSNLGETPQQQLQQNKKRSFSPYELNDPSVLPRTKTSRLSPLANSKCSARNSSEISSHSLSFDDNMCAENWDEEEMEIAMSMDVSLDPRSALGPRVKESSSLSGSNAVNKIVLRPEVDCVIEEGNSPSALSCSSSSSSTSRPFQISTSSLSPSSILPGQAMKPNMDVQSKSTNIKANPSIDDLMKKWLELCKKQPENPNTYSDLMKVEPNRVPFTYLFVLQGYQLPESSLKFRIKGYVSTLLGKLERSPNEWKLMCTLNDGTGTLPVQLSNEVLSQLIGFTVQESMEMTSASSDPSLKKKLQEGVKQCQLKIVNLSSIFEIETNKNHSHPLMTKITPVNAGHIQQLRRQVTSALEKV